MAEFLCFDATLFEFYFNTPPVCYFSSFLAEFIRFKELGLLILWEDEPFEFIFSVEAAFSNSIMESFVTDLGILCVFNRLILVSRILSRFLDDAVGKLWWLLDLFLILEMILFDYLFTKSLLFSVGLYISLIVFKFSFPTRFLIFSILQD